MKKGFAIALTALALTACSHMNSSSGTIPTKSNQKAIDQARDCQSMKRQMITVQNDYNPSNNAAQRTTQLRQLNRDYTDEGCNDIAHEDATHEESMTHEEDATHETEEQN